MDLNRTPCGEDVAPYALGALGPDDAKRFEDHLAGCELCQTDLATLQPVVDKLPEAPDQIAPPAHLKRELMAVVEAEAAQRRKAERPERRSWMPRVVLPALATAVVVAVVGVFAFGSDVTEVAPDNAPPGAQGTLRIDGDDGEIELTGMKAPEQGRVMQVWLMHEGSSTPQPTDALFTPNAKGSAHVTVPGDMDGVTRVLISDEPAGGSKAPTTTPAVDFKLAS
jgi:hypothetical protein